MKKNKQGFTLIELIVTTTIMIVLSAVAVTYYAGTNQRARDARRTADLQKVAMALEMARQVGQTYPATLDVLVPTYMQSVPLDPKTSANYYYSRPTNYTYILGAIMEDLGTTTGPGTMCSGACNYLIKNP